MEPAVSVLMPAYERPTMITEAIASALNQTFTNLEVLIGDNSKTDDVQRAVEMFSDDRITYVRNPPGLGPQENWEALIERSNGKYLATLHDDDVWETNFLERTTATLDKDESLDMVFSNYSIINSNGTILDQYSDEVESWHHRDKLKPGRIDYNLERGIRLVAVWNSPQPAYAALLRADTVKQIEFPDFISPLYDIWLSYQIVKKQGGLFFIPDRLTRYRVHDGSITSDSLAEAEDRFFQYVIQENGTLPVAEEVEAYWAKLKWARATKLMLQESGKNLSQNEFAKAIGGLNGSKKMTAWLGAHSGLVWTGLRWIKLSRNSLDSAV